MVQRSVFLERSWAAGVGGAVGLFHYAVKVDDDDHWYELEGDGKSFSSGGGKRNVVNGNLVGRPRSKNKREQRTLPELALVGGTHKDDQEIWAFNLKWMGENSSYDAMFINCQKYASELIQYLAGGSFKMDIPFASSDTFSYGPASHKVSKDGYYQERATTGKAGAQSGYFAAEAEGPSAGVDVSEAYAGAEASLGRVEVQIVGVGARIEPNVNTGIGYTGGQVKVKIIGFGLTVGKGLAIHTPLGSLGFGRF